MLSYAIRNQNQHQQGLVSGDKLGFGKGTSTEKNWLQIDDDHISSIQGTLSWADYRSTNTVVLTNFGKSIALHDGPRLHRGSSLELELPLSILVGDTQLQFFQPMPHPTHDNALTILLNIGSQSHVAMNCQPNTVTPGAETLAAWFDALGDLQRSVTGSHAFFQQAARAVVSPGGLDGGLVLLRSGPEWKIAASYIPYPAHGIFYRADLVEQAMAVGLTIFHNSELVDQTKSVTDIHSSVICPIRNSEKDVQAIIYGFRNQNRVNFRRGIRSLEAQFVQVVADSIAAALVRMESESEIARTRFLLGQAFPPRIVEQLESDPEFLQGQDREISVLFSDLREFTSISEQIGAKATYQLLTDVMNRFSQIIEDNQGIIIDYFGDGLSAFWNAPIDQPDHAYLACKSALEIEQAAIELDAYWKLRLGVDIRVGVGVHSGMAQVGNSGSQNRLKYGPQGNTVNIASRIESATKAVGHPVLVSGATAKQVKDQYYGQRLFTANLKGSNSPTEVVRLYDHATANQKTETLQKYKVALHEFENSNIASATERFIELITIDESDRAIEFMMRQSLAHKNWNSSDVSHLPLVALCREDRQSSEDSSDCSERSKPKV